MTSAIQAWPRPTFELTGRRASFQLVAFADRDVLGTPHELRLAGAVPDSAPADAATLSLVHRDANPAWFDGWRSGSLRAFATRQLGDLAALDAATHLYTVRIDVDDPADLAHLQLGWAMAARLAQAGCGTVVDCYAITWLPGTRVAALAPDRPFAIQAEIALIAETEETPGFGHAVHTRGMIKFARPDLIAGVPAGRIEHTGRILNHLSRMLAEGAVFSPGERFRFDGGRTLRATPYEPDGTVPDVELNNDALLLVDV